MEVLTEIKSQDWRRAVLGWEAYEADRKLLNSYDTGSTNGGIGATSTATYSPFLILMRHV